MCSSTGDTISVMNSPRNAKTLMVVAGVILLFMSVGIAVYVLLLQTTEPAPAPVQNGNPFANLGSGTPVSGGATLELRLSDGSVVNVPNFKSQEQPVWVSQYEYQVSGSPMEDFLITYLEPDQDNPQGEFLVTLLAEPLGTTRDAAASSLKTSLNLTDTELCGLDATVSAGPGVNEAYAPDRNLGFSGCNDAVALP